MLTKSNERHVVQSYLFLRKCIGVIGIALPIVLVIGRMVFESQEVLDSISAYYYSVMRDVFVGSLWAIAIFLICYRYKRCDDIAGDIAGVCAIGVSLCPIAPVVGATKQQVLFGVLHLLFATCFFITLAFFAIILFRKTDKKPTRRKQQRNMVYLFCGITIIACVVLSGIIVLFLSANQWLQSLHPVLWLESLAILAFGVAWFVKGETFLKDEKRECRNEQKL